MVEAAWWPYSDRGDIASVRLRCLRIVEALLRLGKNVEVWSPGRKAPRNLILSKRYDQASIRHAIELRASSGTRLVLDLCDNHFYADTPDPRWSSRANALHEAVTTVDMVIAATPALADVIRTECGGGIPIAVIGDAVESPAELFGQGRRSIMAEFHLAKFRRSLHRKAIPVGRKLLWFGNSGDGRTDAGMKDLLRIRERLELAATVAPTCLTVISNDRRAYHDCMRGWNIDTHYLDWEMSTFSRAAMLHDIALIPIGINPFTNCKTNNRLATALLHGLGVVADPIPSYRPFAGSAILGDWDAGLDVLMSNHDQRRSMVGRGARLAREDWGLERIAGCWAEAMGL